MWQIGIINIELKLIKKKKKKRRRKKKNTLDLLIVLKHDRRSYFVNNIVLNNFGSNVFND